MNILITSAGQRVSLVRAFRDELVKQFPGKKVLTTDLVPELSAACNVSDSYFKVKRVTDPGYIAELLGICRNNDIRMVVPTIDTELLVLARNRELFEKEGIRLIVSDAAFVEKCRDKRLINIFFQEHGIEIPRPVDKNDPVFPLFIKPYDGSLSVDTFLIDSAEKLTSYHLTNEKLMFMEYMDRKEYDEFTVDMYYDRSSHVKCIVPRKRIHVRAGEINKGITARNGIVPVLKEKLNFIKGAIGCLTVQVFMSHISGRIVAIEINPRFGGGYPLSYRAGANYPGWLIAEYFRNEQIQYTDNWEDKLLMLRYDDEILVHGNQTHP
jgi:carbamoyl-phosphate synthase large subunit